MKILAIDLGKRRIGLALASGSIISGLDTLIYENSKDALTKLAEIIRENNPEKIVIGLPIGNQESEDQVHSFALELNKIIAIPVEFTDETLTSKEAENTLSKQNLDSRSEKYKQEVDKISAKLILEQYINSTKS